MFQVFDGLEKKWALYSLTVMMFRVYTTMTTDPQNKVKNKKTKKNTGEES